MAFTGYEIFPGFTRIGSLSPSVESLAITFNTAALLAMQGTPPDDLKWASLAGFTPAIFRGKVLVDLTSLNGFDPFTGIRVYKRPNLISVQADTHPFDRNLEWPIEFAQAQGNAILEEVTNVQNWGAALVSAAREMPPRIVASVLMKGTPTIAKAKVYAGNDIVGAGLPLFSSAGTTGAHYANPTDADSRRFDNYFPAAGKFSNSTYKTTRQNMRAVPAVTTDAGTLGMQVTHVIGGTIMEEPFREVALQNLVMQTADIGGTKVAVASSNIYTQATTPCQFWIAPQLDADPYYTENPGKHMWISISTTRPGIEIVETVAVMREMMPLVQLFGDGSEMAKTSRMIRMIADLSIGAAAKFPHAGARYEET